MGFRTSVLMTAFALSAVSALAGERGDYVGEWSAKKGSQTLTYDLRDDGAVVISKNGEERARMEWDVDADGGAVMASPQGDFTMELQGPDQLLITPPNGMGPSSVFDRSGG